ncbi:MAG: DUF6671 family protein [Flavobacteriales bacterium]
MEVLASKVLLISKHHKEQIIAPLLEKIGIQVEVIQHFDTDHFGTFTGEIPRKEGPKVTVKEKCLAGMTHARARVGLASEGSFGAHPSIPFIGANEEWLCYIDLDRHIEIYAKSLCTEMTYDAINSKELSKLPDFLLKNGFPKQGLVFTDLHTHQIIQKGIQDQEILNTLMYQFPNWHIETDLRAHQNPLRQKNIALATEDLIKRLKSFCPQCAFPDFSVRGLSGELECAYCGSPTSSYRFQVFSCEHCHYMEKITRKDKIQEDPQYCQNCNP